MKNNNIQHVYLYMDDSGKISKYEDYAVFAGIVFNSTTAKSEFTNKYRSILNSIKCKYCQQDQANCDHNCIEVKAIHIRPKDRRRLLKLSRKFTTFGTVIYNKNLIPDIVNRVQSKGRFNEYAQRRVIKETIAHLIKLNILDSHKHVQLHINIDEMPTKTNGYYTLQEGIREELAFGIVNYNYGKTFRPILHGGLIVNVNYKDSKTDIGIQMADIIANTIHRSFVLNNNWFDSYKYLTKTICIDIILRLPS